MSANTKTGLQLRSLIKNSGELEISLASVPTPEPGPDEVVVRVEASPINPSDLGLLVGGRYDHRKGIRFERRAGDHGESAGSGDEGHGGTAR
jgi:threonine dehydrogenase-like Zn-dependent dehydrogenase